MSTESETLQLLTAEALCRRSEQAPDLYQLRRLFTLLAKQHFSTAQQLGEYKQQMPCFDPADPTVFPIRLTYGSRDKAPDGPGIQVGLERLQFQPLGIGSGYYSDTNSLSGEIRLKKINANLTYTIFTQDPEACALLAESATTMLECSKGIWMAPYAMTAFSVVEIIGPANARPKPEDLYQTKVVAAFSGSVVFKIREESLLLEAIRLIPSITDGVNSRPAE